MQIKIIWTGSGTERGYQMRLQHLSIESNGFGVRSTGKDLDRVKKTCAFVLNNVASDLWAF